MSLRRSTPIQVPDETARVAKSSFPGGNAYLGVADALGSIFTATDFADLYPKVGQPGEDPVRLALDC